MTYYEDAPNIMKRLEISSIIIMFLLLFMTAGCGHAGQEWNIMDHAESLMQEMPDSALDVLEGIDVARLTGKEEWKNRSRLGQCAGAGWDTFDGANLMIFSETVAF